MPYGRGKEQSICLLALVSYRPLAPFTSEALPRVTNRLRMHLEVLPRVAHGAHFIFYEFSFNFLADRQQRRGLKLCGPFAHVRVCADDGVSEISGDLERPT